MKKRKILLGLALAAAAVFSLSACGDDTTPTTTPTTEGDGGSGTGTGTGTGTGGGQVTPPTVETFTVTFYSDEAGTTVLETKTVNKGSKATAPTNFTAPAGKKLDFWSADGATPFDFNSDITKNTSLKPVLIDLSTYDEMAASTNKVIASDFSDITSLDTTDTFDSTTAKFTKAGDGVSINALGQLDMDTSNVFASFGGVKSQGVLKAYFEVQFEKTQGEAFAQLNGTSAVKSSLDEVFALRTSSGKLNYRFDAGSDIAIKDASNTQVAISTSQTYKFLVELDMATGKLTVTVNGDKLVDSVDTTISSVNGLKFTCKAANTDKTKESPKIIDNVAVTFEAKEKSPLVLAREAAVAELDAATLSSDASIKAAEEAEVAKAKLAIAAADTVEAVNNEKQAALDYIAATKYTVTVKAYSAANTAVTDATDVVKVFKSTDTVSLTDVSFSGYNISKFYTDETLATEYVSAALTANITLYAKVVNSSAVVLDLAAILNGGTSATIEKGSTVQEIFSFYGKDVADTASEADLAKRNVAVKTNDTYGARVELTGGGSVAYKSSEAQHMPANCIGVTCASAGTIKVTIQNKAASDSSDYTGKDCQVVVLQRVVDGSTVSESKTKISGKMAASDQTPTEFTIEIAAAGTYYIGFSHNGGYIYNISFQA